MKMGVVEMQLLAPKMNGCSIVTCKSLRYHQKGLTTWQHGKESTGNQGNDIKLV